MDSNPLGLDASNLKLVASNPKALEVFTELQDRLVAYLDLNAEASRLFADPSFDADRFSMEKHAPAQRALVASLDRFAASLSSFQDEPDLFGLLHGILGAVEPYFAQFVVSYHLARVRAQYNNDRPYERLFQESVLLLDRVLKASNPQL